MLPPEEPHTLPVLSNLICAFSVAGADGVPQVAPPTFLDVAEGFEAPQLLPLPADIPLAKRIPRSMWQTIMTVKGLI